MNMTIITMEKIDLIGIMKILTSADGVVICTPIENFDYLSELAEVNGFQAVKIFPRITQPNVHHKAIYMKIYKDSIRVQMKKNIHESKKYDGIFPL